MVEPLRIHRCIACRLRWDLCVCEIAPRLRLPRDTKLIVLMHVKEWRRSSNTGHYARFGVDGARVVLHGREGVRLSAIDLVPPGHHPLVLFPGNGAVPLSEELVSKIARPVALIVPDGNWGQASQMVKRLPGLSALPTVTLPRPPEATLRLRRNVHEGRMSTLEAIAQALGILEGRGVESTLQSYYQCIVTRMMYLRGRLPAAAIERDIAIDDPVIIE